jgi:hypothetical protein
LHGECSDSGDYLEWNELFVPLEFEPQVGITPAKFENRAPKGRDSELLKFAAVFKTALNCGSFFLSPVSLFLVSENKTTLERLEFN